MKLEEALFFSPACFKDISEAPTGSLAFWVHQGQIVVGEDRILGGETERLSVCRRQDVTGCGHQFSRFGDRLFGERKVDGHLVSVEVGVVRWTDQGVNVDGLSVDEDGLERLHRKTMESRRAVQEDRMILDEFFQDVPYYGHLTAKSLVLDLVEVGKSC